MTTAGTSKIVGEPDGFGDVAALVFAKANQRDKPERENTSTPEDG